jgi:PAS domain S-box-containing protein
MAMASSIPRWAMLNLLAAAACTGLGIACLAFQSPEFTLPALWLPMALGLVLFAAAGPKIAGGVWAGQVGALFPLLGPQVGIATGEAAAAWLGAVLLKRLLPRGFDDPQAPVRFLVVAYACAAPAALFSPMLLRVSGALPLNLDGAIISWWLADALGVVVLVPVFMAWRQAQAKGLSTDGCSVLLGVAAATAVLGFVTFISGPMFLSNEYLQAALLLPPTMALAMRCHPAAAYSLTLILVVELAAGAAGRFGPSLGITPIERDHAVHGFALLTSMSALFLSTHVVGVRRMAAAAKAGEERFRRLTALTSDWYWEQDVDFRFTCLEGSLLGDTVRLRPQFLGRRSEELPGFEPYNMSWEAHRRDREEHRMFQGFILRYARDDGRINYYSVSGEPMYDERGQFSGYRGVGRDVTPEIESREALLAGERQFHDVADATFEALLVHDYGRVVFVNRACAELAGRPAEELIGRPILDFVAPEEHPRVIQKLAANESVRHYETIGIGAGGRRLPVEVFGRPFVFQGKPLRIIAIRDVSERQRTEAALRAQIEFQRTLLDTIPSPVFFKDRNGRYLGYNRSFAEWMGIGPDDYIGKTVLDLIPGETGRSLASADERLYGGGAVQHDEQAVNTVRGRRDVVIYKGVFQDDKQQPAGLVGVVTDISERKKNEQRLRRFQELSPAAIGIVSTAGEMLYMNPAAYDLFGYGVEDVPNMEVWWQIAYPDSAYRADRYAAWVAAVELALREGRSMFRFDGRVRCMDGTDRWIETMVSLGEEEIFMIFTDLTEYVDGSA